MNTGDVALLRRIRLAILLFIVGLVASGVTAFPLQWELGLLVRWTGASLAAPEGGLLWWLARVQQGIDETYARHAFLGYGTDWLAFGHIVIAMFFVGPLLDPVRNAWVLRVGLAACAGVVFVALICGPIRGIPFYWRLIDCSFAVFGALPLLLVLRWIKRLPQS